jgi:hypothetical protein
MNSKAVIALSNKNQNEKKAPAPHLLDVYLEIGKTRVFAGALDWPGWCRSGRDEASALQVFIEYGSRYAKVLRDTGLQISLPSSISDLVVAERLAGNSTTDFGAPAIAPSADLQPMNADELGRSQIILKACWHELDDAIRSANGRELRKGPRGGGRDLMRISEHVHEAEIAYLAALGRKFSPDPVKGSSQGVAEFRQEILAALAASACGEIPPRGPRGGLRWTPRFFVRRLAWHALDHAWEIGDRIV